MDFMNDSLLLDYLYQIFVVVVCQVFEQKTAAHILFGYCKSALIFAAPGHRQLFRLLILLSQFHLSSHIKEDCDLPPLTMASRCDLMGAQPKTWPISFCITYFICFTNVSLDTTIFHLAYASGPFAMQS